MCKQPFQSEHFSMQESEKQTAQDGAVHLLRKLFTHLMVCPRRPIRGALQKTSLARVKHEAFFSFKFLLAKQSGRCHCFFWKPEFSHTVVSFAGRELGVPARAHVAFCRCTFLTLVAWVASAHSSAPENLSAEKRKSRLFAVTKYSLPAEFMFLSQPREIISKTKQMCRCAPMHLQLCTAPRSVHNLKAEGTVW